MNRKQIIAIATTMVVTFCVTVALSVHRDATQPRPAAAPPDASGPAQAAAPVPARAPLAVAPSVVAAASKPVAPAAPAAGDAQTVDLPLTTVFADTGFGKKRVTFFSASNQLLGLSLRVQSVTTEESNDYQLNLLPEGQSAFTAEGHLAPGDQITVQAAGYRDLVLSVP